MTAGKDRYLYKTKAMIKLEIYQYREQILKAIETHLSDESITEVYELELVVKIDGYLFVFEYSCNLDLSTDIEDERLIKVVDSADITICLTDSYDREGEKIRCSEINETLGYLEYHLENNAKQF